MALVGACLWPLQARKQLQQRGLAHAVAPHEADRLALAHGEVNAAQDVAGAVVGVQALGLNEGAHACSSPR